MYTQITVCTLDNLPYQVSPCFKVLVDNIGLQKAALWTEEVDVPLGDDDA